MMLQQRLSLLPCIADKDILEADVDQGDGE